MWAGKYKTTGHGSLIIGDEFGNIIFVSDPAPGCDHDMKKREGEPDDGADQPRSAARSAKSGQQQRVWLAAEQPDLRHQRCGLITERARDVPAFAVAEKDDVAEDVGIDGGAASVEEAAVHIVEP
jgi:hypothetical protein